MIDMNDSLRGLKVGNDYIISARTEEGPRQNMELTLQKIYNTVFDFPNDIAFEFIDKDSKIYLLYPEDIYQVQ